ncbi:MAG: ABC transporter permease [Chloroflexota bacterium]
MSSYLAIKEIWRNRGRFLLFSLVIALVTTLVLFIAGLATGLADSNRQFIDKLEADLLVFQENVDLQSTSSRLELSKATAIRRIEGVADAGPIGFSAGTVVFTDGREPIDISLVGIDPGRPGDPAALEGQGLRLKRKNEAVIDSLLAGQSGLKVGDSFMVKTIQGTEEELYELKVAGITDERRYFFQPSVILSLDTWDKVRPQPSAPSKSAPIVANMIAVKLANPADHQQMALRITRQIDGIEVADKRTTILALPGYSAQQNTLNTQQAFTFLIGVLILGGFFQIQTLQKVAQIGVLKAIGSSSRTVALSVLFQIIFVTVLGVAIGGLGTLLLAMSFPAGVPIVFNGPSVMIALIGLLLIGPIGGLVSIRLALRIDPLTAIGLSS